MSRFAEIADYLRQCPQLENVASVAADIGMDVSVVLPNGGSSKRNHNDKMDVDGGYECDIIPYPSFYEDYRVQCYKYYDTNDESEPSENVNVIVLDEVQEICDWIEEQDNIGNLPIVTGRKVVSIEPLPNSPELIGVNTDVTPSLIAYYINIRVRYVNTSAGRSVYYAGNE